jgi:hypothetical protein
MSGIIATQTIREVECSRCSEGHGQSLTVIPQFSLIAMMQDFAPKFQDISGANGSGETMDASSSDLGANGIET